MAGKPRVRLWGIAKLLFIFCLMQSQVSQGQSAGPQDFARLQESLRALGWHIERSPSGDVLLWPVKVQTVEDQAPGAADPSLSMPTGSVAVTDFEALTNHLQQRGWNVTKDETGSLVLRPAQSGTPATSRVVVERSSAPQQRAKLSDLQVLLNASGWQTQRDHENNLLLIPRKASASKKSADSDTYAEFTQLVAASDALSAAGWRVRRNDAGDLLLTPKSGERSQSDASASPGRTVSSTQQAGAIARGWLKRQGAEGKIIGKIRRIKWVYLVSLVTANPPHKLVNQLVVRVSDGRVIPVY